jgi:guanylate kinase
LTACNNLLALVMPHTSREPCANENDDKDFVFVHESQMGQMLQAGAFAVSWSSNGHQYGMQRSLIDDILKTNRVPLLKLTAATLLDLKTILASATVLSMYLLPSPLAELTERLDRAGTRSQGEMPQVLEDAEADAALLQLELVCDIVLPNARLEDSFLRLKSLR